MKRRLTEEELDSLLTRIVKNVQSHFFIEKLEVSRVQIVRNTLKKQLANVEMYVDNLEYMKKLENQLVSRWHQAMIQPGENVGVACAQSIGERQTQLCCSAFEKIWIKKNKKMMLVELGRWIDEYMENYGYISKGDSDYSLMNDIWILYVSEKGMVGWIPIIEVSRHLPNGDLLTVTTESGRCVTTTKAHAHLKYDDSKIIPYRADQLQIGDSLPVLHREIPDLFESYPQVGRAIAFWLLGDEIDLPFPKHLFGKKKELPNFFGLMSLTIQKEWWETMNELDPSGKKFEKERQLYAPRSNVFQTEDVRWETITDIQLLNEHLYLPKYVYDISVLGDRTFMLSNGLFVHNTLNTFHSAGLAVQTVVTGVPRFLELLNATKEPKCKNATAVLRLQTFENGMEIREKIGASLVGLKFGNLLRTWKFLECPIEEPWFELYETVYHSDFRDLTHAIKITLDRVKMCKYRVSPFLITEKIEEMYDDVRIVFSPMYDAQIDIFVDTTQMDTSSFIDENTHVQQFLEQRTQLRVYLEDVVLPKLLEIPICGVSGIHDYQILREDGKWKIQTDGSNLLSLLSHPLLQTETIMSNHMWEIYDVMGIEAVRTFLKEEFLRVVSSDGTFINTSHILLLVDIMTFHGTVHSISRYGMKKEQNGPLAKASFEECLDHFLKAGLLGEKETIQGVSASIMCGKRSQIGTGLCDLRMNWTI